MIKINFVAKAAENINHQFFFIDDNMKFGENLTKVDNAANGLIKKICDENQQIKNKFGESIYIPTLLDNQLQHIFLFTYGGPNQINDLKLESLGGKIYKKAKEFKAKKIQIHVEHDFACQHLAFGLLLASYTFDKYKTVDRQEYDLEECSFVVKNPSQAEDAFQDLKKLQQAIFLTRDLVNEVPNELNTDRYTQLAIEKLSDLNVEVSVLNEDEMRQLGMQALLGVGQGSSSESKLVIMHYNGLDQEQQPIALVGKGVTFDTGGISLKPANNMHEMKYDMAGSASVFGAIRSLASIKAKVNVVGIMALVENMPDGNAQRPGDVVKTMSGQTIEVLNTDAEGRLILADALYYTQETFKPKLIIDLATLTGAIVVALGSTFAGCFSNNDQLAQQLIDAGIKTNEKLWRMPMHEDFDKMIKSEVADWANIGNVPGAAGSAVGAHLLEKFVAGLPWAHLDIAGLAWEKSGKDTCPKGATGYGVRLLTQFILDNYAAK